MLIIGEKINSSIPATAKAIANRDAGYLHKLAEDQAAAGAGMIDINAGTFIEEEADILRWLIQLVREATEAPLCIDSPNPATLNAVLSLSLGKVLINSISLEKDRYNGVLPIVKEFGTSIVALCMDDQGIPKSADKRIDVACRLAEKLNADGIEIDDIYFDVLVQPLSVDDTFGMAAINTVRGIRQRIPGAHTTGGLSNISFGLPERKLLNSVFTTALISAGMDTLIIDPLDRRLMASIAAAKALTGQDEYCDEYLSAYRSGKLKMAS